MTPAQSQAAQLTGTLWEAICLAGGTATRTPRHFGRAFDPAWLTTLPLPVSEARTPGQPVAMLDAAGGQFERYTDSTALHAAYAARPRTRIYEDIGWGEDESWAALVSRHLTRLAGGPQVSITVYESVAGDAAFTVHRDAWFGVIVQIAGMKRWCLGEGAPGSGSLSGSGGIWELTLTVGDVLLLPKGLPHLVTTPDVPGHSIHLVMAIDRDQLGRTEEMGRC